MINRLNTWIDRLPTLGLVCFLTTIAIAVVSLTGALLIAISAAFT